MSPTQRQLDTALDWDGPVAVRGLHTVAMVAAVLGIPVSAVRHWVRGGLLRPIHRAGRIGWFDYGELLIGRRLARLLESGFGLREIDARLAELHPDGAAAAARLGQRIVVDGRRLSVRSGENLLGAGGQRQFGFYTADLDRPEATAADAPAALPLPSWDAAALPAAEGDEPVTGRELLALAAELEACGDTEGATEALRALLQAEGPSAHLSFMLAELLYRSGDLTAARERYYTAIEFDEDHLEARTSLGCVLSELGDHELAEAALEGVLRQQPDYADAHWHLAGVLDEVGRESEAIRHLRTFVALSPDSPWVRMALDRLAARG